MTCDLLYASLPSSEAGQQDRLRGEELEYENAYSLVVIHYYEMSLILIMRNNYKCQARLKYAESLVTISILKIF